MVAAHAKGYTYKQIETLFENRRAGKSFLDNAPIKAVARSFVDIGKALFEYRLRPQSPSTLRTFLDRERPLVARRAASRRGAGCTGTATCRCSARPTG